MKSTDVTIETPKGTSAKFAVNPVTGQIKLVQEFYSSLVAPVDYGYVEQTLTDRGGHMSAFVLLRTSVFPGVSVSIRVVGSLVTEDRFRAAEGTVRSETRVIGVPAKDPRWKHIQNLEDIPTEHRAQMEFFVRHRNDLSPSEHAPVVSWGDVDYTNTMVDVARLRFDSLSTHTP